MVIQLNNAYMIDHTVMEFFHEFEHTYAKTGGTIQFIGLESHDTYSRHPLSVRKMKPDNMSRRKSDLHGLH